MEKIYQIIIAETENLKKYPSAKTNIMDLQRVDKNDLDEVFKARGSGYCWDDRRVGITASGRLTVGDGPYYWLGEVERVEFDRLEEEEYEVDEAADWSEKSQKVTRKRIWAIWKDGSRVCL